MSERLDNPVSRETGPENQIGSVWDSPTEPSSSWPFCTLPLSPVEAASRQALQISSSATLFCFMHIFRRDSSKITVSYWLTSCYKRCYRCHPLISYFKGISKARPRSLPHKWPPSLLYARYSLMTYLMIFQQVTVYQNTLKMNFLITFLCSWMNDLRRIQLCLIQALMITSIQITFWHYSFSCSFHAHLTFYLVRKLP